MRALDPLSDRRAARLKCHLGFILGTQGHQNGHWICSACQTGALRAAGLLHPFSVPDSKVTPDALFLIATAGIGGLASAVTTNLKAAWSPAPQPSLELAEILGIVRPIVNVRRGPTFEWKTPDISPRHLRCAAHVNHNHTILIVIRACPIR